jgi:fatty-acyl-CoA synthase
VKWELDWIHNRARVSPNKIAVIDENTNRTWTYAEINRRAGAASGWMKNLGVKKGDRIALLAPNHICYLDLLLACGKIGAIFVPLNWRLSASELVVILEDCKPKLMGIHKQFHHLASEVKKQEFASFLIDDYGCYETIILKKEEQESGETISEHDPLAMIYTGGTTGKPKGVVLSHQSIIWNAINTILSWGLTSGDITLNYMPMFHTGGLNALTIPILMAGGTVVIGTQFEPKKAAQSLNDYRCTTVLFVPTMYHQFIQTEEFKRSTFPTMEAFISGAAPCPIEVYEAFQKKGLPFKEGYGLTEAGPNNFYIHPEDAQRKRGSVGKPMLFNSVKIIQASGQEAGVNEVGELLVKGKHGFSFYWNNQAAVDETVKDGWIHTGDLARKDEEGYYYIVGRKKEMIITGGENVYPLEVEQWLAAHPNIDEAAVLGLPDEKWGEIVAGFVVLKSAASKIGEEELKVYCEMKLGRYKIPKRFLFLDVLPKTDVGKIDKKKLRELGMESSIAKKLS